MKIGSNAPCPCGSGKKFKKCHDNIRFELPYLIPRTHIQKHFEEEGKRLLEEHQAREIQRQAQQGLGRPIISIKFKGYRFVAVGSSLHYGKWKTFEDFLGDYIKKTIGEVWGNAELRKPLSERHPILRWYHHVCTFQRQHFTKPGEIFSGPMTGAVSAYYRLAYNLYLIAHNGADIQTRLVARLRSSEHFAGAFFETQVAAWLIRAGFELEFENESDRSTSHCEFLATYGSSKKRFSVEAKSRNPGANSQGARGLNIGRQLRKALQKKADHTRLIFLDLNHPIANEEQAKRLVDRANYRLKNRESLEINGLPAPPAYVCLTNISDHYFLEQVRGPNVLAAFYGFKIPDFFGIFQNRTLRDALRARERHIEIYSLMQSIEKHIHIPSTFDGDLPSAAFSDGKIPRMQIGQIYLTPGADGIDVPARLTTATVDKTNKQFILAFHDEKTDRAWITKDPMTEAELEDYTKYPDTFFGSYHPQGRQTKTPMDLFDFMYESYRNTPKEKLLEFMSNAADISQLKELSQQELSEIYCERCVYSIMAQQKKSPTAEGANDGVAGK